MPSVREAAHRLRRALHQARWPVLRKTWRDRGYGEYAVISRDPPIIRLVHGWDFRPLYALLRSRSAWFLVKVPGGLADADRVRALRDETRAHRRRHPGHRFVVLGNTSDEVARLQAAGLDAVFVNSNAFVDERLFDIDRTAPKLYDAIHDAQLGAFKRHELTVEIRSLAIITYLYYPGLREAYPLAMVERLRHATWLNPPYSPSYRRLTPTEVCYHLNRSRVGLCLSAVEGAMFASVQYLLCGLPLVTTPSRGGRDVFFDEGYVATVPPDATAVRRGVEQMIERAPDPALIRALTLDRMQEHRARFIGLVDRIYAESGVSRSFRDEWPAVFFHKLQRRGRLAGVRDELMRSHDAGPSSEGTNRRGPDGP